MDKQKIKYTIIGILLMIFELLQGLFFMAIVGFIGSFILLGIYFLFAYIISLFR